jgi:hypothetical protein
MKTQTLEALNKSIEHWREVVSDPWNTKVGALECALCGLFNNLTNCFDCGKECPVSIKTGKTHCSGSPYSNFAEVLADLRWSCEANGREPTNDEISTLSKLAEIELNFLIALRPNKN